MKISDLKTILEGFNDNDEVSVTIAVNNNEFPVVTNDIGYNRGDNGELTLEVAVYHADFDYQTQ